MIVHSNPTITGKRLRAMLARELLGIRNLRWRLSPECYYWMIVTAKTCYSHINQEYVEMEALLWQARTVRIG